MKFAVTIVTPPGYPHSPAFQEVAESIHYGLISLGYNSVLTKEGSIYGRQHIILGSNLLPHYPLPIADNAILYNLEQVDPDCHWFNPELIAYLRRHTVWDFSPQNVAKFKHFGVEVARILPIGYAKELTRIQRVSQPDVDVVFFGMLTERRKAVLNSMMIMGLKVAAIVGLYGAERDQWIARAKLVLNLHQGETKVLEMVRISYLLANQCTVLSEPSSEPEVDQALADGVAFASYDNLAAKAKELIAHPEERQRLAQRGFELIKARPIENYLRTALS